MLSQVKLADATDTTFRQPLLRHKQNDIMELSRGDAKEAPMEHTTVKNASAPNTKMTDLDIPAATGSRLPTMPKEDAHDSVSTAEQNKPVVQRIEGACDPSPRNSPGQAAPYTQVQEERPVDAANLPCELCDKIFQKRQARNVHFIKAHLSETQRTEFLDKFTKDHKAMHEGVDLVAEEQRRDTHQMAEFYKQQFTETRDQFHKDMDSLRTPGAQREHQTPSSYDDALQELTQRKMKLDRNLDIMFRRAHDWVDRELHSEELLSLRETHLIPGVDRQVDNTVLHTQDTADAEESRRLGRLFQREKDIIARLNETAQRHQEIEESEHARRLDELSQREALLVREHKQRMREAKQHELDVLDAEEAKAVAELVQLGARKARLDVQKAQLHEQIA